TRSTSTRRSARTAPTCARRSFAKARRCRGACRRASGGRTSRAVRSSRAPVPRNSPGATRPRPAPPGRAPRPAPAPPPARAPPSGAPSGSHHRARLTEPLDPNLAVFAAYWYRGYACNPRAIHDRARELVPGLRGVWIVNPEGAGTVPDGVEHVLPDTEEYFD